MGSKPTLMPVVNWQRHTAEEWLEGYGIWLEDNPTARRFFLGTFSPCQAAAELGTYRRSRRSHSRHDITDTEGFRLMKLLQRFSSLRYDDPLLQHAYGAVLYRHVEGLSWPEVARQMGGLDLNEVRAARIAGLAWLSGAMASEV